MNEAGYATSQNMQSQRNYSSQGDCAAPTERPHIGIMLEALKQGAARLSNNNERIAVALAGAIVQSSDAAIKAPPAQSVEQQLREIASLVSAAIDSSERALQSIGA